MGWRWERPSTARPPSSQFKIRASLLASHLRTNIERFRKTWRAIRAPLSQPLFVVIDAIKPLIQSVRLSATSAPISIPGLSIPGTTSPDPVLEFELSEQVFRNKPHSIQLRLLTASQSPIGSPIEIVLPAAGSDGQSTKTQSIQALLSQAGLVGQQDLIVRATDVAGNSFDSPIFSFFVFAQNRQSYDALEPPYSRRLSRSMWLFDLGHIRLTRRLRRRGSRWKTATGSGNLTRPQ